jgi:hypothetical protein
MKVEFKQGGVEEQPFWQRQGIDPCILWNHIRESIPNFYIVKGTYFLDDYVNHCEQNVVRTMQPNVWMAK